MKKFKVNLALVAVLLGSGAAFASTHKTTTKFGNVLWGLKSDGITWAQTTLGASCTSASHVCKEYFPQGQDPNDDDTGGTVQTNNGYIQ